MQFFETPYERRTRVFHENHARQTSDIHEQTRIAQGQEQRERSARAQEERRARSERRLNDAAFVAKGGYWLYAKLKAPPAPRPADQTSSSAGATPGAQNEAAPGMRSDDAWVDESHSAKLPSVSPLAIVTLVTGALFFFAPISSLAALALGVVTIVKTRQQPSNPWDLRFAFIGSALGFVFLVGFFLLLIANFVLHSLASSLAGGAY